MELEDEVEPAAPPLITPLRHYSNRASPPYIFLSLRVLPFNSRGVPQESQLLSVGRLAEHP
eukprot:724157-Prorocentrum_minimum.AAC.1